MALKRCLWYTDLSPFTSNGTDNLLAYSHGLKETHVLHCLGPDKLSFFLMSRTPYGHNLGLHQILG